MSLHHIHLKHLTPISKTSNRNVTQRPKVAETLINIDT